MPHIKSLKRTLPIILVLISLFLYASPAFAETTETRSVYSEYAKTSPSLNSTGLLTIKNRYRIVNGSGFTDAEIHTYVERRMFNTWWRVNNGQPNNEWAATPTATTYSKTYTLQLLYTGTYRVTADFTFNGSYGSEPAQDQESFTY